MQDYEYVESGARKRYELTIPILLLILVFLVVAWKVNWLPDWFGIFGGGGYNILIVGQDPNIEASLLEMRQDMSINYKILDLAEIADIGTASYLDEYNLIILTESLGPGPADMPAVFRGFIETSLSKNKDLIVFGIAASRDPADPGINGWGGGMDQYIPVECKQSNNVCDSVTSVEEYATNNIKLKINDPGYNHAILEGYTLTVPITSGASLRFANVNPDEGGNPLASLEVEVGGSTVTYPAIIENAYGIAGAGRVVYFAYHPSKTPTVFKNTIQYLGG